jgi:CcdB protein
MRQFDICRLRAAPGTKRSTSLVIVLQADLLDGVDTCVVAPLVPLDALPAMPTLRPEFQVGSKRYRLITDRMSVLARKDIGAVVVSVRTREWDIRRALDLVFVGV